MVTESGWRKEHPAPYGWLENLAWPVDENSIAFTVAFDGYPAEIYIYNNVLSSQDNVTKVTLKGELVMNWSFNVFLDRLN